MTKREVRPEPIDVKALLAEDSDRLRAMMQAIVQATLEVEMTAALGAEKGERSAERLGSVRLLQQFADHAGGYAGPQGSA